MDRVEWVRESPYKGAAFDYLSIESRILCDLRKARKKGAEASGNWSSRTVAPFLAAIIPTEPTSPFVFIDTANLADGISELSLHVADTMFKGIGSEIGISGFVLDLAAGTSAQLAIGPVARVCSAVSRGAEIAGIIFGILTGGHLLVIFCAKKLFISETERLIGRGVAEFLQGSDTDKPPSIRRIPGHTLDGPPDKLHVALGQDVTQWVSSLMERQSDDNPAALRTPRADPPRALRERLSEEALSRNLRRQQRPHVSRYGPTGNVLRTSLTLKPRGQDPGNRLL
jgi:hypothetical protein